MLRAFAIIAIVALLTVSGAWIGIAQDAPRPTGPDVSPVGGQIRAASLPLNGERLAAFEDSIAKLMREGGVPGGAVAVVQQGEIVYLNGFGVRELGKPQPVTPDTLLMIGSVTKPMTSMLAATLVDDGRLRWDTPLGDLLPGFATADPALTARLTVADAFCACTGLPRQDLQLLFSGADLTAEALIGSVTDIPVTAPFGETFQYSNQMFATGGYAITAGDSADGDLYSAYVTAMRDQFLIPVGMPRSTFAFADVEADGDYALPHGWDVSGSYRPLPLTQEAAFVSPVAPAGGLWSSAREMARYLQTLLAYGVSPDGLQVVSAENLETTWTPQVTTVPEDFPNPTIAAAYAGYGLGWVVGDYHGQRMLSHSGSTLGFDSQLAIWPEAELGIVVLTNAGGAELAVQGVQFRLAELLFDQPAEIEELVTEGREAFTQRVEAFGSRLGDEIDPAVVVPHLGNYFNPVLGEVSLTLQDGTLFLDAGELRSALRPRLDEHGQVLTWVITDPPLAPLPVVLSEGEGGTPILVIPDSAGGIEYVFMAAVEATPLASSP